MSAIPKTMPPSRFVSFFARHGCMILALVPFIFLLCIVIKYAVDVPYCDQWELVPLLGKTYHGELSFYDLWTQHNEHRLVFPQIIMLVLARLTGWNIYYELTLNLIFAIAIFLIFIRQLKTTEKKLGSDFVWAAPAISLIVFSISQYQNWLWGWQLQMLLNLLAVVGGITLLANETFNWKRFSAAAFLGIVATYSFANGILFWPVGLAVLCVRPIVGKKRAVIIWTIISALILSSFFYHYETPPGRAFLVFQHPMEYICYALKYIGNIGTQHVGGSYVTNGNTSFIFGLMALIAFAWAARTLLKEKIADFKTLLPYFGMSLYSIGSALLTGVGRMELGSNQAISSRYSTMDVPFWISLVVFLMFILKHHNHLANKDLTQKKRNPFHANPQIVAAWSLVAAITILILGSVSAVDGARLMSHEQAIGRAALLNLSRVDRNIDFDELALIYPKPNTVVKRYPLLLKYHLSVFRESK